MDGVTRQTSQHVEYEPEWEGAFNLQLKLSDILTIVQDWCATDVSPYDLAIYNPFLQFLSVSRCEFNYYEFAVLLYLVLIRSDL